MDEIDLQLLLGTWNLTSHTVADGTEIIVIINDSTHLNFQEFGSNINWETRFLQGGIIESWGSYDVERMYTDPISGETGTRNWTYTSDEMGQEGYINYTWRLEGATLFTLFQEPGTSFEYPSTIVELTGERLVIHVDLNQPLFSRGTTGILELEYQH